MIPNEAVDLQHMTVFHASAPGSRLFGGPLWPLRTVWLAAFQYRDPIALARQCRMTVEEVEYCIGQLYDQGWMFKRRCPAMAVPVAYHRKLCTDRLKLRARLIVARAVRSGALAKPSTCARCGSEQPVSEIHAHHEDYSKPLLIMWLCAPCHRSEHGAAA